MKFASSILFFLLLLSTAGIAQTDTAFHYIKSIKGDIVSFTVDNLDNAYILNSRNQIKKYNANGDSVGIYNDIRKFGRATLIDVSNPLKVLLYYKDFATVVMLDRFLNPVNTVDLRKQAIYQAKAIAQSYDNKIWVFDEVDSKLKKIDEDGKLLQETTDFRFLLGKSITPIKIAEENQYLYLYDSTQGVYVFDYYGAFKNNILIQHWNNFKVAGKYIYGSRSDSLFRYEISSYLVDEWKMPVAILNSSSFQFSGNRLYALKENEIKIYDLK